MLDLGIGEGSELHAPADGAPSLALLLVAALLGVGVGVGVAAVTFSGIVSRRRGVPESETPRPVMDFAV